MALTEALYKKVHAKFEQILREDPDIEALMIKKLKGTASYKDSHEYGTLIGNALREALDSVSGDYFKGGSIPFDVAERLIGDHLRESDELMNAYCEAVQKGMNDSYGIGVKPITPASRESTITGVVTKVTNLDTYTSEALDGIIDFATWNLETADMYMRENSDFLSRAGVPMMIMRTYEGRHWDPHRGKGGSWQDCKFCMERATNGWEDYSRLGDKEIFRRHRGCRCMVITQINGALQTAWTNKKGADLKEAYAQERKRLRELDSMDYAERYQDLKAKKRERDRARRRTGRNKWLNENT